MTRFFTIRGMLAVIVSLFVLGLLLYIAGKIVYIDQKLAQIARPAKLFSISNIQSTFPNQKEWEVNISPELDTFFYVVSQQQFNWLGRGAQALAFESQDGRYVLKLFQVGRMKTSANKPFYKSWFSSETEEKKAQRLQHREEIFTSSKLCFEELQEETGIVYVHLNRTKDKIKGVKLVDRFGQSHRIRGDDACFVLQKKAACVIPELVRLIDKGEIETAKERVDQVIDLLHTMAKKGVIDNDDALIRNNNLGFTKDRAIYIDTGHLVKHTHINVGERMRYEFNVRLDPLEKWLNWTSPEVAEHYRDTRDTLLAEYETSSSSDEDLDTEDSVA